MSQNLPVLYAQVSELARIEALVLDSVRSAESRRAYRRALDEFYTWCTTGGTTRGTASDTTGDTTGNSTSCTTFTKAAVQRFRSELEARGLSASSINVRLSAIRKLASEAADNGLLAPEVAASIIRIRGTRMAGHKVGTWLTIDQAERLLELPKLDTRKGKRDLVILAVLLGCGLRRKELSQLKYEHIQQRDGRWVIANLIGKGGRLRTVPMPLGAKLVVDHWAEAAGSCTGRILRAVNKSDHVTGACLSPQSIFRIVCGYGIDMKVRLAPHDLRRTFAKLAHKGHAPLEQIQLSLGHASILTTERYLGIRQDLTDAPCDHLGISLVMSRCS